jgi:protein TonB
MLKFKKKNGDNLLPYGASELKRFYQKFTSKGFLFAVFLHAFVLGSFVLSIYIEKLNADKIEIDDRVRPVIDIIEFEFPEIKEPETPEELETVTRIIPRKDPEALIPQPVKTQEAEVETTKNQDELNNINVPVASTGDETGSNTIADGQIRITEPVKKPEIEKEIVKTPPKEIFETYEVDQAPSALNLDAVKSSMIYPNSAKEMGIEGRVVARVLVGKNGSVERIGSLNGPSAFHNEVRSKITGLKFTPAVSQGETVRSWVSVPFSFKLQSKY